MLDTVRNQTVNGLDLAALGEVVDAIQKDPGKAKVGFDVVTRWKGQTRTETEVSGFTLAGERIERSHRIVADEPCELLGGDSAPNPQELLMAALNACMTVGYVAGCSLKGIHVDSIEIATRGELDLRGFLGLSDEVPPGYAEVDYRVRIASDGSPTDLEEVHRTVMKTSPNYYNFGRPIRMNGELVTA
ncbi:OsmC family peroxiredoxin [Sphingomonas ginkgonis]|uniref:OsmC family peroxiredoxin n=1 Tax=Sphingomonas ginkgonis TaxID=2315330 RepID=A0A429V9D7_9SPHN|nr:OsmC family protein [Sphingomonas ginkgonis]RST30467.1 OsmC family peroxiredoxin [Sphingomonas ginkgonis]